MIDGLCSPRAPLVGRFGSAGAAISDLCPCPPAGEVPGSPSITGRRAEKGDKLRRRIEWWVFSDLQENLMKMLD